MAQKNSSSGDIHKDHRSRMREKFIKFGFDAFADHEKLEYLLFYCIPRVNTNPTAHLLLEKFGSFAGVLDAPESELATVPGIGESSINFLKLLPQVASYYVNSSKGKGKRFEGFKEICSHIADSYIGITDEQLRLICLDDKNTILFDDFVAYGSVDSIGFELKEIISIVLSKSASKVVIAHNHPRGMCKPSHNDLLVTSKFDSMLKALKIKLVAHILVAEGKYCLVDSEDGLA